MKLLHAAALAAIVPLAWLSLTGCGGGATKLSIAELNANPGQYSEQVVRVGGRVTQVFGVQILQQSVAKIDDGSGQVWVKPYGRVPAEGEEIEVEGTVKVGFTIANRDFGVLVVAGAGDEDDEYE